MLEKAVKKIDPDRHAVPIKSVNGLQVFPSELEFNAPSRGLWNIVHTGMLIPQSHQIFVCAQGCLRGVIMTAAEMNAMDRMSFVALREHDLFDGTLEDKSIEGITAIISEMPEKPKAILLFFSCVQLFAGCDLKYIISQIAERFPEIDFIECLMHPTMRKSGLSPDAFMRKQLYAPLKENLPVKIRTIGIIGNDFATKETSELIRLLLLNGFEVRDITKCQTYEEYLSIAQCEYFLSYYPTARVAAETLGQRLKRQVIHVPLSYSFEEIMQNYQRLGNILDLDLIDWVAEKARAVAELEKTRVYLANMPIAIDYTATLRNLSLARLLLDHGFNVQKIYTDTIIGEEAGDLEYLKNKYPNLLIQPTLHPSMRFAVKKPGEGNDFLAIGQKAACYLGSCHLVNIVSGGTWYGLDGIVQLCQAMREAKDNLTDTEKVIQIKGWGCDSCL